MTQELKLKALKCWLKILLWCRLFLLACFSLLGMTPEEFLLYKISHACSIKLDSCVLVLGNTQGEAKRWNFFFSSCFGRYSPLLCKSTVKATACGWMVSLCRWEWVLPKKTADEVWVWGGKSLSLTTSSLTFSCYFSVSPTVPFSDIHQGYSDYVEQLIVMHQN